MHNDSSCDVKQLEADVRRIEGIVIGLHGDNKRFFRTYPLSRPSPGRMRGREWLEQFEKWYPDIEVIFPSEHLTLAELRIRHSP